MPPSAPLPEATEVVVVGAGLSGLACALLLERRGIDFHLIESSDDVGGRVRTDDIDGFRLDRGFQVLLTAYDEVQALVDLPQLDPKPFEAGSLIWNGRRLERMPDPFRNPLGVFAAATARVGHLSDKVKVARLRRRLLSRGPEVCFEGPERSTREELQALGFSDDFVDVFFRPFLGGVFLERALETSASLFRYYMRCFAAGDAIVPAEGMQRLPELLASPLEGRITFDCPATAVSAGRVTASGGRTIGARSVVVATDGHAAAALLGTPAPDFKATVTAYYAAPEAPVDQPLLVLDGEGTGPANHLAVMSHVAPAYAPPGSHLISVSGVDRAPDDPDTFQREAPPQLKRWFGSSVDRWEPVKTYRIAHALPRHPAGSLPPRAAALRHDGVIVAGDYTQFGAIQGALRSGRLAAEAVLAARAS